MRLKKKTKSMTNRFTTLVTTVSLFGSSFTPIVAEAQQQQQQNGGHWVNTVNGLISGFGNMYINMVKQNNAQILAAQQMQSLAPKAVPSKFFPNCPVAQASTNFPEGVCDSISSPAELQTAMSYKSLALTYQGFFEQLGSTAQNTRTPVGLQCLEDNKQYVISSLNDRQNALQSIIDNIKKQAQLFRDQNNASLDQMYELNVELKGLDAARGSSRANPSLAQQDRDFLKYFGEQCQNIIGVKTIQEARQSGGLIAIKDDIQSTNIKAQNFTANSPHYERELNQHIQQMKADVDKYGVEPFMKGSTNANEAELAKFGGIKDVITQKFRNFELNKTSIQKKVTAALPNFNFPEIDKDFEQNFDRFRRSIASFDKGKYINDCITMNSQGYGLTTDQVVKLLRIPGLTTGNSLNYYKDHLTQILESSATPEEKLTKIQNINGQGVTITYDSNGKQITTTPYDYYRQIYTTCESLYSQDGTMVINQDSQDINNVSNSSKVASVQAYLDELRTMQRNFKEDLGLAIFNKIINCDGRGVTTDTCSGSNEALFDTTQSGFCVAHAKGCSNDINNCYRQAETRVNERMQVLSNKQAEYNAKVANFINVQDAILKDLKAKVDADSEYIKRFFPGANYMFPADMFVSLPEEAMSDFGVMLRGGGSFDFTEELPAKIEKLKEQLREQSSQVASVIDSYISEQESALRDNQSKWDNLKNKCESAEKGFREQVAKQNAEGQKAQAEQDQAVGQFCNRFNRLKNMNPAAGCDGANSPEALYEDLSKVSARIDPSVEHRINQYAKLCAQSQSERSKGSEDKSSSTPVANSNNFSIADLCTGGSNLASDEIKAMALKNLSAEDKRKAESYIKGDSNELPASLVKNQPAEARILKKIKDIGSASPTPVPSDEYFTQRLRGSTVTQDIINKLKLAVSELGGSVTEADGKIACNTDNENNKKACTTIQTWLADGDLDSSELASIATSLKSNPNSDQQATLALNNALKLKGITSSSFQGMPVGDQKTNLESMKKIFNDTYPDTETGFCGEFKRLAATEALSSCMSPSKGTASDCFKEEFKKNYEQGNLEDIKSLSRSVASVQTSNNNNQWSRLGEQAEEEPCEAQANTARNSFGNFLQNFDASVLGNSNGLNGIMR